MCGYCIEAIFISSVEESDGDVLMGTDIGALFEPLQEVEDFPKAIDLIDATRDSPIVAMCRVLEHYWLHGFDPTLFYKTSNALGETRIEDYFFESTDLLDDNFWRTLFHRSLYKNESVWSDFVGNRQRLSQKAHAALLDYYYWWLCGIDRDQSNREERFRLTGITDPLADTPSQEWNKFYARFPVLFLSLAVLQETAPDDEIFSIIATSNSINVPDFEALDLWLQRRAFRFGMAHSGVDFFKDTCLRVTKRESQEKSHNVLRNELIH